MSGNVAMTISGAASSAVSPTVPTNWLSYVSGDLGMFLCAVVAYYVLCCHFKFKKMPKKSCQELYATSEYECSEEHIGDVAEEVVAEEDVAAEVEGDAEVAEEQTTEITEQHEEPKFNVNEHLSLMEKYASERNIGGAMRTFRTIRQSGESVNSHMYNVVLQAWINCGNIQAAEDWMDEILEANMADKNSFGIIIKALVQSLALDKATELSKAMARAGVQPCAATFNELLGGFARDGRFNQSLDLLDEMHTQGVQPTSDTLEIITKLINGSRNVDQGCKRICGILRRYKLDAAAPRLAAVMSQGECSADADMPAPCAHEIHVTGSLAQIKSVRKTLKQLGFLDKSEKESWPLDGHWETEHGLTVIIEGKLVRWSGQRASRLSFTSEDRSTCMLALYGEHTRGRLVSPTSPDAKKTLRWANGDVWHSYDGRVIGQEHLFNQSMTKTLRDKAQDEVYRTRSNAVLKCVSKHSLGLPAIFDELITQYLGNDLYYVRVCFASKKSPSSTADEMSPFEADADICTTLSRRHPRVGLRHCWTEWSTDCCGQRTLVNGEEVDEGCFNRHIGAACSP